MASNAPGLSSRQRQLLCGVQRLPTDNKGNASKRVQTEVVISGAGMSADRTALTLDGQSRIQMLANGNEQKPLVLSLARRRGPASHGHERSDQD